MKHGLLSLLSILLILSSSCEKKKEDILHKYIITVVKDNPHKAYLDIEDEVTEITETAFSKEVELGEYDVYSVSLKYAGTYEDEMILSVKKVEDGSSETISGSTYMWIVFSEVSGFSKGGGNLSAGSGSGGSGGRSSSDVCPCGARTKDGTPCKRMVKGCGRCWQHD